MNKVGSFPQALTMLYADYQAVCDILDLVCNPNDQATVEQMDVAEAEEAARLFGETLRAADKTLEGMGMALQEYMELLAETRSMLSRVMVDVIEAEGGSAEDIVAAIRDREAYSKVSHLRVVENE